MPPTANADHVRELTTYADNARALANQRSSILLNLWRKVQRGVYDADLAPRLWRMWFDVAARQYRAEFGTPGVRLFSAADLDAAAEAYAADAGAALLAGEHDGWIRAHLDRQNEERAAWRNLRAAHRAQAQARDTAASRLLASVFADSADADPSR